MLELCSSIECYFGATCKLDANYKQPYCDCEKIHCDNALLPLKLNQQQLNAQTYNRTAQIVCGFDNRTYNSLCELKKEVCLRQKRIEIQYYSPCVNKNLETKISSSHSSKSLSNDKGMCFNLIIFKNDDSFIN